MSASFFSIFMVLGVILALVVLGLVVAVVLARRGGVRRPSCGACGYAVAGLDGLTCPECGADLREVGIVTPSATSNPWLIPFMVAILWSIGLAILGSLVTPLVYRAYPRPYQVTSNWTLTPTDPRFATVTIDFAGAGSSSGFAAYDRGTIRESVPGQSNGTAIRFELPRFIVDASGQTLDESAIAAWLVTNDPGRPAPEVDQAAGELLKHLQSGSKPGGAMIIQGPAIYAGGGVRSMSGTGSPPNWLLPSMTTAWGVVWLLGLWFIVRRYRARRASTAVG